MPHSINLRHGSRKGVKAQRGKERKEIALRGGQIVPNY
jgi:hypothetical protein